MRRTPGAAPSGTYEQTAGLSNGNDDTSTLNALLSAGSVKGVKGQTYIITTALVIPSGRTLDMTGCTVQFKSGSTPGPMLTNSAFTTATTVMDGAMTAGSAVLTSAGSFSVGQAVLVWGAGPFGEELAATVSSTGAGTATLSVAASTTVSATPVTIGTRDTRIVVRGGVWDRNNVTGPQDYTAHTLFFRRADHVRVEGVKIITAGGKFAINFGDCRDYTVRDIEFATASDGVHITGPATRFLVANLHGTTGDDMVSMTGKDFAGFTDVYGPISDFTVQNVYVTRGNTPCAVKLISGNGYTMRRGLVDGVFGHTTSPAVKVIDDNNSANTQNSDIAGVTIRKVKANTDHPWLVEVSAALLRSLVIEGVVWDSGSGTSGSKKSVVHVHRLGAAVTAGLIRVRDVEIRNGDHIYVVNVISDVTSVDRVEVDGVYAPNSTTGVNIVNAGAPVSTITVRRAQAAGTFSVVAAPAQCSAVIVEDSVFPAGSEVVLLGTSTNTVTSVHLSNVRAGGGWLVRHAQPADIHLNGCHFTGTQSFVNASNAAATTNIYGTAVGNPSSRAGLQTTGSPTVKCWSLAFTCDVSLLTAAANELVTNTNASHASGTGPLVCDGTTWRPAKGFMAKGTATLVAGTVTVSDTKITSTSDIRLFVKTSGGTQGILSYTRSAGASFTVNSTNAADTSTIYYEVVTY